jgi:hypothetical protein
MLMIYSWKADWQMESEFVLNVLVGSSCYHISSNLFPLEVLLDLIGKLVIYEELTRHDGHSRGTRDTALITLCRSGAASEFRRVVDPVSGDGEHSMEPRDSIGDVA